MNPKLNQPTAHPANQWCMSVCVYTAIIPVEKSEETPQTPTNIVLIVAILAGALALLLLTCCCLLVLCARRKRSVGAGFGGR